MTYTKLQVLRSTTLLRKKCARIDHSSHTLALKIAKFAFWSHHWTNK